jgi:hypothetical protein
MATDSWSFLFWFRMGSRRIVPGTFFACGSYFIKNFNILGIAVLDFHEDSFILYAKKAQIKNKLIQNKLKVSIK